MYSFLTRVQMKEDQISSINILLSSISQRNPTDMWVDCVVEMISVFWLLVVLVPQHWMRHPVLRSPVDLLLQARLTVIYSVIRLVVSNGVDWYVDEIYENLRLLLDMTEALKYL